MKQLILGGARSGKSRFAQTQAEAWQGPFTLIVTASVQDEEMAQRVARHQAERPAHWQVIEASEDLPAALQRSCCADGLVLVDCVTLWLAQVLCNTPERLAAQCAALCDVVKNAPGELILVSNEVGWGIVPEHPLGRIFRDEQGRLNQQLAACVERVTLVVAGLPLPLK